MAEEFAFQQTGGNGGAVEFDEGGLLARAEVVDGARQQFLAGAGFAVDQHRGIGGRHGFQLLERGFQSAALAHNLLEAVVGADLVFQVDLFLFQALIELFDALVGKGVIEGNCHLSGHLGEEAQIVALEAVRAARTDIQGAQGSAARDQGHATERLNSLAFEQFAGGGGNSARLLQAEHPALPAAEDIARQTAIERHDRVLADGARAIGKIQRVHAQGADFGVVDQQAGVFQAEGAAQRRGDGPKQLARLQATHYGIVDFEQGAQAVAIVGQLFFVGRGGFGMQCVIHRHRHLARHLAHEFDIFRRVGIAGERAEMEAAEFPLRRKQRQDARRLHSISEQQVADHGEAFLGGGIGDIVRAAGLERGDGGRLFERRALRRRAVHRLLGFQNMHADHALFGVDQGETDEIKGHQAFEQAAEVGEKGGELVVDGDGFGHFEQRLVARSRGVRTKRCGG